MRENTILVKQPKRARTIKTSTIGGDSREGLVTSLQSLSDFRMHTADILCTDFACIDHTSETLDIMRDVYTHDDSELSQIDSIERKIQYTLRHRPRVHSEILASTIAAIRLAGARSVVDVGCGEGLLLRALLKEEYVERIVGVDNDPMRLSVARGVVDGTRSERAAEVDFRLTGEVQNELDLKNIDFASVTEVVEHIADKRWIDNVFSLDPKHIVVTTPNRTFNALYSSENLTPEGYRHPDHVFEFNQEEFKKWAKECGERHGYIVDLLPIGHSTIEHGSTVSMAIFTKSDT